MRDMKPARRAERRDVKRGRAVGHANKPPARGWGFGRLFGRRPASGSQDPVRVNNG